MSTAPTRFVIPNTFRKTKATLPAILRVAQDEKVSGHLT